MFRPPVGSGRGDEDESGRRRHSSRVKFLPLAWAGMPKTSFRKNSDSPRDEEKYFDNYKTDLANARARAKSPIAIEQQALLGLVTHLLMRLFLHKKGQEFGLEEDHQTQQRGHEKKEAAYIVDWEGNYNRAFFKKLSKITKQAWRFLKNNFLKKSTLRLFEYNLRPSLMACL